MKKASEKGIAALEAANRGSKATGTVLAKFSGTVRSMTGVSAFAEGDVFVVANDAPIYEEIVRGTTNKAEYCNVLVVDGPNTDKVIRFYPSALTRSVEEYEKKDGEWIPKGGPRIQSGGSAATKFQEATNDSIENAIKVILDKPLKVSKRRRVDTVYGDTPRTVSVLDFDFVEE